MATTEKEVVDWLLGADVAVAFQTARDLLGQDRPDLRERIASEGQGAALLAARGANGHWGRGSYQPKWTSSHYTLLELKNLGLSPETEPARETVQLILRREKSRDGWGDERQSFREGAGVPSRSRPTCRATRWAAGQTRGAVS